MLVSCHGLLVIVAIVVIIIIIFGISKGGIGNDKCHICGKRSDFYNVLCDDCSGIDTEK